MVEKWADLREVKPFSGSGHVILPEKLGGQGVRVRWRCTVDEVPVLYHGTIKAETERHEQAN